MTAERRTPTSAESQNRAERRRSARRQNDELVIVVPVNSNDTPTDRAVVGRCKDDSDSGLCIAVDHPLNAQFLRIEPIEPCLDTEFLTIEVLWSHWDGKTFEAGGKFVLLPLATEAPPNSCARR